MKKILVLIMALVVSTSASYAASFWSSIKNAFKQDVKATEQAIKTDIQNSKNAQTQAAATRKKEALKEVNDKISALNKDMKTVKNNKNITETERTIRINALQKQIDLYNKEKKEIQKW